MRKIIIGTFLLYISQSLSVHSQCGGQATFTDVRDGRVYNIIQIDGNNGPYCLGTSQCWMAEDLDIGTRINGTTEQTNNATIEKYCYNDNNANCTTYGGLYQWDEMMNYGASVGGNGPGPQGICPTGWHIPTDHEWRCMEMNLGMTQAQADGTGFRGTNEGDEIKVTASHTPAWDGTNTSNFDAIPSGRRDYTDGSFELMGSNSMYWTSTVVDAVNAWQRTLFSGQQTILRGGGNRPYGNSVRCIRDNAPVPLPIELLYFKAKWTNDQFETVTLDWETITESENSHFEIERSIDAVNFEYVKNIDGNGNSNENVKYTTLDEDPYVNGTSYYRLKQVDNNGDFEYSNIEALNIPDGLNFVNLYPNPVVNELTVLLTSSENTETVVSIKNNLGQVVTTFNQSIEKGFNTINFDFSKISTGNYIIEVNTTSGLYKVERKFIKSKQ